MMTSPYYTSVYYSLMSQAHSLKRRLLCTFIGLFFIFFNFQTYAATAEQIEAIQTAAQQHILNTVETPLGAELSVKSANIDSRIQATDCPEALHTSASSSNGSASTITVLVECLTDQWKLYVPVKLSLSVPLVTAATPIPRGQIITEHNTTISMVDLLRFRRQGFSLQDSLLGAKTKKNLNLGDVIEQNDICVVCRNESVIIYAQGQGMSISTQGIALNDGIIGEQIKVRNERSKRIIDARVIGVDQVSVAF